MQTEVALKQVSIHWGGCCSLHLPVLLGQYESENHRSALCVPFASLSDILLWCCTALLRYFLPSDCFLRELWSQTVGIWGRYNLWSALLFVLMYVYVKPCSSVVVRVSALRLGGSGFQTLGKSLRHTSILSRGCTCTCCLTLPHATEKPGFTHLWRGRKDRSPYRWLERWDCVNFPGKLSPSRTSAKTTHSAGLAHGTHTNEIVLSINTCTSSCSVSLHLYRKCRSQNEHTEL